jgi:alkaline phosphatase
MNSDRINRRRFLRGITAGGLLGALPCRLAGETSFLRLRVPLPQAQSGDIQFGLVTDTHYGDYDDTTRPRFFRSSLPNMEETVAAFNERELDFAVHLGDVIQESHNRQTSIDWLRMMDARFRAFNGDVHYVIGNHDLGDMTKADFIRNTSGRISAPNYHFDHRGYRFITLDANYRQDGVAHNLGNFSWIDAALPPEQLQWLSATLDEAAGLGMRAIIFTHQNFDDTSEDHRIKNSHEAAELIASKGIVDVVFCGHRHAGGLALIRGVHYITMVATVNGADMAAGVVRVQANGVLTVTGLGGRQVNWGPFKP